MIVMRKELREDGRRVGFAAFGDMDVADEPTLTYSRRAAKSGRWPASPRHARRQSANPRSNSLTLVLLRVRSSTCLTITAQ